MAFYDIFQAKVVKIIHNVMLNVTFLRLLISLFLSNFAFLGLVSN